MARRASVSANDVTVLIAGGGTAGHVLPGLAVAEALVASGVSRDRITWVGALRGIETELVPAAGFSFVGLPGRGIQRRLTKENLRSVAGLIAAMGRAAGVVRSLRPNVVLTLGGYASIGPALAAAVTRVPIVVAEQNARAGAANRIMARFATVSAVPFAATDLPRSVVTGNPVRAEILDHRDDGPLERAAARGALGWPTDRMVVAVFAGSLGSHRINQAVVGLVERWVDRSDVHVHHAVGRRDYDTLAVPTLSTGGPAGVGATRIGYERVAYEERMDLVLAGCDVAVCRSGGTTVAELAIVGVPSILVPLPIATRDHQTANAQPLRAAGAAVVVADAELDVGRLERELAPLLDDASRRSTMAAAAHGLGTPGAATAVAMLVLDACRVAP